MRSGLQEIYGNKSNQSVSEESYPINCDRVEEDVLRFGQLSSNGNHSNPTRFSCVPTHSFIVQLDQPYLLKANWAKIMMIINILTTKSRHFN